MSRPYKPYSQRNVSSYERDREYLMRLRGAIWLDPKLDGAKVKVVLEHIDELVLALRDLSPRPAA